MKGPLSCAQSATRAYTLIPIAEAGDDDESSRQILPMNNPLIKSITALKTTHASHSHALLTKLSLHVQEVMKSKGWTLKSLSEFMPSNPNLLGININRGQHVKIRLRHSATPDVFIPFHDLIGTMLHELVHNAVSSHDASFYKLLDEIYTQYESQDLTRLDGSTLGSQRSLTPGELKAQQRKAAEKRLATQRIMSGGRRLGGSVSGRGNPVLEAAEKRARDSKWCSTGQPEDKEVPCPVVALVASRSRDIAAAPTATVLIPKPRNVNEVPNKVAGPSTTRPRDIVQAPINDDVVLVVEPSVSRPRAIAVATISRRKAGRSTVPKARQLKQEIILISDSD